MFINLTPHKINIHGTNGTLAVEPSGKSLRVSSESKLVRVDHLSPQFFSPTNIGVEFYSVDYGAVEMIDNATKGVVGSLPENQDGVVYIVSGQCLEAVKQMTSRNDFAAPGELVRDANGQPVGCKGLRVI